MQGAELRRQEVGTDAVRVVADYESRIDPVDRVHTIATTALRVIDNVVEDGEAAESPLPTLSGLLPSCVTLKLATGVGSPGRCARSALVWESII